MCLKRAAEKNPLRYLPLLSPLADKSIEAQGD